LSAYWQIEDNLPLKEQNLTVCNVLSMLKKLCQVRKRVT
jgi:hypothetical protein